MSPPPLVCRNPERAAREASKHESGDKKGVRKLPEEAIDTINEVWQNNEMTSAVYEIIEANDFDSLRKLLSDMPELAHIRSEDGRGPMFWAHEKGRSKFVKAFRKLGVRENVKDSSGRTPLELSTIAVEEL